MEEILITGSGSELQGVGRLSDGRAVFVPGALPGEKVRVEITKSKDRFAEAQLLSVIEAAPERQAPDCPYYPACGGCRARHMTYESSLRLKRERVYSALTRIGGLDAGIDVASAQPSPLTQGYRNKAELACAGPAVGVFEEGSRRVIDTERCLLQPECVNALLAGIRPYIKGLNPKYIVPRVNSKGEMMLTLSFIYPADIEKAAFELTKAFSFIKSVYICVLRQGHTHALDGRCTKVCGADTLTEELCGLTFSVSPRSFFQVNRLQAEKLYSLALEMAELKPGEQVCDIYCGAGTISLCAARTAGHVTGIEIVPEAIRDAKSNAKVNKLTEKTEFLCGDAAKLYPKLARQFDCVITDPPRAGMEKPVIDALIEHPAKRLVYVSCDPGTLARDIKLLTQSGAYKFVRAIPVDMFPWTGHVETVVLLVR